MPKRKSPSKYDEDVIRTEPDRRRATGNEEDDDFEQSTESSDPAVSVRPLGSYVSVRAVRSNLCRRSKTRAPKNNGQSFFPFMFLPAEIRYEIYRYVVISRSGSPISLCNENWIRTGGINTAILLTSRQIHSEAIPIMYNENKFEISISPYYAGISFRKDDMKSTGVTSRALRSGRDVDMLKYTGLIYEHVALRLQNVHIQIRLFDRAVVCTHAAINRSLNMYTRLKNFYPFLKKRYVEHSRDMKDMKPLGKGPGWTMSIISPSEKCGMTEPSLTSSLHPLLSSSKFFEMIRDGSLQLKVKGKFTSSWTHTFRKARAYRNFNSEDVVENNVIEDYMDDDELFWVVFMEEEGVSIGEGSGWLL